MNLQLQGALIVILTGTIVSAVGLLLAYILHRPSELAKVKVDEASLVSSQLDILKKGNEELIRQNTEVGVRYAAQSAQMVELRESIIDIGRQLTLSDAERVSLRLEVSDLKTQIARMAVQLADQSAVIAHLSQRLGLEGGNVKGVTHE